ncbi:MAG: glycosyltransferase family 9 protein [Bdellovibrionales bacterium]
MTSLRRILVIRLGALGDLVLCFQAFHEIRQAHPGAEIALLTMPGFAHFAHPMPWFDRLIIDPRPSALQPGQWFQLIRDIRDFRPDLVYDLQGKRRQNILYALLGGPFGPQWSGNAPFCRLPRFDPPQKGMHYTEFVSAQLRLAGVPTQPPADLGWLNAPVDMLNLPARYAVLVPGSAPHREYKRWPPAHFAVLAQKLQAQGIASIAVGTRQDKDAIAAICAVVPGVADYSGRTSIPELAGIMRRAVCVVANDTGPMHIAAALGVPTLGLMSDKVDAEWSAPHGPRARWLRGAPLAGLSADKVFLALREFLDQKK